MTFPVYATSLPIIFSVPLVDEPMTSPEVPLIAVVLVEVSVLPTSLSIADICFVPHFGQYFYHVKDYFRRDGNTSYLITIQS